MPSLRSLLGWMHGARPPDEKLPSPYAGVLGRSMASYFDQVTTCYASLTNPFSYYETLVSELLKLKRTRILPLFELSSCPTENQRIVALRHDVDADPVAALRCARYLARRGVCGSFYLQHTAPYYGDLWGGVFVRNPDLVEWVRGFIVAGCELGLHNDCLRLYMEHGLNGADALRQEVQWLRSIGACIRGTVGHNSGVAYGAENAEIFAGRVLWPRELRTADDIIVPLGSMSEIELGLIYEGTFLKPKATINQADATSFFADKASANVRSEAWMRRYLLENPSLEWGVDCQVWLIGSNEWVAAGRIGGRNVFLWKVGIGQVMALLEDMPDGARTVLVVHPEYVRGG